MIAKLGERVQFRPTHAKELLLTGVVLKLYQDSRTVDIESEPGNGSVSRIYSAHLDDCQACEQKASARATKNGAEERSAPEAEAQ